MGAALEPAALPVTPAPGPKPPVTDIFAEITAGLADGQQLEALLRQFLGPIVRLAGAQAGLVRTLSDDGEHMRLVGDLGLPEAVRLAEQSVDRHCGTCGIAADHDTLTWSRDVHNCARQNNDGQYFGHDCKRMLAVPLRHRGRLLGLYNLFFDSDVELGPDILAVLRSIGELLGLALHNARLERETLCATVMNERRFLASEVHDTVAQNLAYVNMRLPLLQDAMLRHDDDLSGRYLTDVKQAVGSIQANLREILVNFRVPMDPQGLLHGLRDVVDAFGRRAGIPLDFRCEVSDLGLSVEQEVQVFHIVQEALANVCRHARASRAWLTITRGEGGTEVLVEDDGQGLLPPGAGEHDGGAHFGLGIMRERAQRLGGQVETLLRPGGGTRVRLTVPIQDRPAREGAA